MYKAATARIRTALDGFTAGEITIQDDGLHFPIVVSDSNGKLVARHPFILRPAGECTSLTYDEDGNVTVMPAVNPDAAAGALELVLAAFAKVASKGERTASIGDDLLTYLVTIGLLPR
jgi:metallophosphoesterase superfamily enzyme